MPERRQSFTEAPPQASTTSIKARAGDGGDSLVTYHPGIAGNIMLRKNRRLRSGGSTGFNENKRHKMDTEKKKSKEEKEKKSKEEKKKKSKEKKENGQETRAAVSSSGT